MSAAGECSPSFPTQRRRGWAGPSAKGGGDQLLTASVQGLPGRGCPTIGAVPTEAKCRGPIP